MRPRRLPHPLDHQPSFRAVVEAAPSLAELATRIADRGMISSLAIACGDLASGFAAPPDSQRRIESHQRAWVELREIDRVVVQAARGRRAPRDLVARAQRAIDRADVLVGALLP